MRIHQLQMYVKKKKKSAIEKMSDGERRNREIGM